MGGECCSGFAVIGVLLATTVLTTAIMLLVWRISPLAAMAFLCSFLSLESVFLSALLFKVPQGAWLPILLALLLVALMYTWHYGTSKYDPCFHQKKRFDLSAETG